MDDQKLETTRRAERALVRDCETISRLCTPRRPAAERLEAELGEVQARRLVRALAWRPAEVTRALAA